MKYDIEERPVVWKGKHKGFRSWKRWYPVKSPVGRWWTLTQATTEAGRLNSQMKDEAAGRAGTVRQCRRARQM